MCYPPERKMETVLCKVAVYVVWRKWRLNVHLKSQHTVDEEKKCVTFLYDGTKMRRIKRKGI